MISNFEHSQYVDSVLLTSCDSLFQFDGYIDLDSYDTIAMKLRGDGRTYISTVRIRLAKIKNK